MCGIAGVVWTSPAQAVDDSTLRRITDTLTHRGPDDSGLYRAELHQGPAGQLIPGVGLGHRRLSIIDVAGGHQPLSNEDGTVWVVFNGEIYNHHELRQRLEGAGHQFRTKSDTETIVHLYEDEGLDFARRLWGMFALALWDGRHGRLILARDRLGKKPLVYRHERERLLFASELKAIVAAPGVPRTIDPQAIDLYLTYQYVPHPWTIYAGTCKLPPGCQAVFQRGKLEVQRYWNPDFNRERGGDLTAQRTELRDLLSDAVRRRMESEVPLGAFLSGGIDSTIIAGLMQQASKTPVKTFSIGFPSADFDETRFAREAAQKFGTEHRQLQVTPQALDVLPKLVHHYDEPFADSSALPTWYVSELTRQHVTVALSGDGGDETFVGYDRFRAVGMAAWFDRWPAPLKWPLLLPCWQWLPAGGRQRSIIRRFRRVAETLSLPPAQRYLQWISIFNESARAALYDDGFIARLPAADPIGFLQQALAQSRNRDPVTQASLADLVTYLPCGPLTKVDIASMAHGLEVRCPFLDHRVVELAAEMPIAWKLRGSQGKRILRETFADLLPDSIQRRPKMGFGVPLADWFRGELNGYLRETLLAPRALERGYFRPDAVRKLIEDHSSKRFDHSHRLWALLFLELWQRAWID